MNYTNHISSGNWVYDMLREIWLIFFWASAGCHFSNLAIHYNYIYNTNNEMNVCMEVNPYTDVDQHLIRAVYAFFGL